MTSLVNHRRTRAPKAAGTLVLAALVLLVAWSAPAVAAGGASPAANSPTAATGRATFGIGPSSGSGPDGRSAFTFDVTRGAHLTDRLAVVNYSQQPMVLTVYPVDAKPDNQGGAQLPPAGVTPAAAGSWFHLSLEPGDQVSVAPQSTVTLPFTVEVPAGASSGDHEAALIASLSTYALNKQGTRVRVDQRIAVRAYLRVAGAFTPRLEVEQLHVAFHAGANPVSGTVTASYVVRNAGNIRLGASQQVSVHGLFGATATASGLAPVPVLPPGASQRVSVRLSGVLPEVHAQLKVVLQPLAPTGDVDGGLTPVEASQGVWTVPWVLLAILGLLALGLYLVRRWRRRLRPGSPPTAQPARKLVDA
jgi:hypothetical protein